MSYRHSHSQFLDFNTRLIRRWQGLTSELYQCLLNASTTVNYLSGYCFFLYLFQRVTLCSSAGRARDGSGTQLIWSSNKRLTLDETARSSKAMKFWGQLRLLLWKNGLCHSRQKLRVTIEVIWPLLLFLILMWVRTRGLKLYIHECKSNERPNKIFRNNVRQ